MKNGGWKTIRLPIGSNGNFSGVNSLLNCWEANLNELFLVGNRGLDTTPGNREKHQGMIMFKFSREKWNNHSNNNVLGGSSQDLDTQLGSPPLISHGKAIWKGNVAILRGRTNHGY